MQAHPWRFFIAGGVDQVRLETSDDLRNLGALDQKLWVTLSCPVAGHDMDERTMGLIDADGDGRVRAPEILAAVDFVCRHLKEPAEIFTPADKVALASFREDSAEGKAALATAKAVLATLGKGATTEIALADVADTKVIFAKMPLNGDGIVHPGATTDPALSGLIEQIVATTGGEIDRSGVAGVSAAGTEAFFTAVAEFKAWDDRATTEAETLLPLGAGTAAASAALAAVSAKIDDFFGRTRLASFDARSVGSVNRAEPELAALAAMTLSPDCDALEGFPLAHVEAGKALPLSDEINPAWAARMAAFVSQVVQPLLGERGELLPDEWGQLKARLAPHAAWQADKGGVAVSGIGAERAAELLAGDLKDQLNTLIAADEARRPEAEGIDEVERLVRYNAHLGRLLRNYVNFSAFYGRKEKAIFQAGTVYFDQRSCELVMRVEDAGRHGKMAGLAGAYLAYFDCVRRSDGLKLSICAAVTDGDVDNIMVGRNGVFYDRKGRDYDAQITKIVENPISVRQAFWSPYKKFLRSVEDMVAKRAAAAEAASSAKVDAAATATANVDTAEKPPEPPKPLDIGTLAAIGVAVGGISAVLGAIMQAFFGLGFLMPLGILGLVLLISGPSMFIAALKLRRRNLGPILDADGWAVNARARVNIPFGKSLTSLAKLPEGAARDLNDPYAQKASAWPYVISVLLIVGVALFAWYSLTDGEMGMSLSQEAVAPAALSAPSPATP